MKIYKVDLIVLSAISHHPNMIKLKNNYHVLNVHRKRLRRSHDLLIILVLIDTLLNLECVRAHVHVYILWCAL